MWTLALKVQHQQVFTANKEVKCFKVLKVLRCQH